MLPLLVSVMALSNWTFLLPELVMVALFVLLLFMNLRLLVKTTFPDRW